MFSFNRLKDFKNLTIFSCNFVKNYINWDLAWFVETTKSVVATLLWSGLRCEAIIMRSMSQGSRHRHKVVVVARLLSSWWSQGCQLVAVSGRHRVLPIWRAADLARSAAGRGRCQITTRMCWFVIMFIEQILKLLRTEYFGDKIWRRLYSSNIGRVVISLLSSLCTRREALVRLPSKQGRGEMWGERW